jgi:hypothetical protein
VWAAGVRGGRGRLEWVGRPGERCVLGTHEVWKACRVSKVGMDDRQTMPRSVGSSSGEGYGVVRL